MLRNSLGDNQRTFFGCKASSARVRGANSSAFRARSVANPHRHRATVYELRCQLYRCTARNCMRKKSDTLTHSSLGFPSSRSRSACALVWLICSARACFFNAGGFLWLAVGAFVHSRGGFARVPPYTLTKESRVYVLPSAASVRSSTSSVASTRLFSRRTFFPVVVDTDTDCKVFWPKLGRAAAQDHRSTSHPIMATSPHTHVGAYRRCTSCNVAPSEGFVHSAAQTKLHA